MDPAIDVSELVKKAINASANSSWENAIALNEEILKTSSNDISTLNRLAQAYLQHGRIKTAKRIYEKVLKLDTFNPIAKKNLDKLRSLRKIEKKGEPILAKVDFLEEPGKTKTVSLTKLGSREVIYQLTIGQMVNLKLGKKTISVYSQKKEYLGRVPDDLSLRLISLIKRGNRYAAFVRLVEKNKLQIFIKEFKRSKRNADVASFPKTPFSEGYYTFVSEDLVRKEPPWA